MAARYNFHLPPEYFYLWSLGCPQTPKSIEDTERCLLNQQPGPIPLVERKSENGFGQLDGFEFLLDILLALES